MKCNAIGLTVAAVLTVASHDVRALSPAVTQSIPAANTLWVSGTATMDTALQALFKLDPAVDTRAPCVAGTLDIYRSITGYLMSCTTTSSVPGLPGTNVVLLRQVQGGAVSGIANVARGTWAPGFTDKSTLSSSSGPPTSTAAAAPFASFNTYPVTSAEVSLAPNAGMSDLDPALFVGTAGVIGADAGALTVRRGYQQPFAVIVSLPLYRRLQTAEGIATTDDAFDNTPSMTLAQLRTLLEGGVVDWGDEYVDDRPTHNIQTPLGNGSTSGMHICRYGDTSGAELAANVYFFGAHCSSGSGIGSILAPDAAGTATSGATWNGATDPADFAFAGATTGDVKKCVSSTLAAGDTVNYRIGFIDTNNKPTNAAGDTWRYIAIGDQPGALYSILQGRYEYLFDTAMNSSATSLALNGGLGNHGALWTYVASNIGDRIALTGANQKFTAAWDLTGNTAFGDSGALTLGQPVGATEALTLPLSGATWPTAVRSLTLHSGPASTVSRGDVAGAANSCNAIFVVNPTS